jgi:carbon-monoxide dehydrogenase small subunit
MPENRAKNIAFKLNGRDCRVEAAPQVSLLELLRENLHLTGTKEGCGVGDCGICLVLLDGKPVNSCLVLAVDVAGREVVTIEGLATGDGLHPLQESFIEYGAVQCGFCSPAMILAAKALLDRNPDPSEQEIKQALSGILCRCGSYKKIIQAVRETASKGNR